MSETGQDVIRFCRPLTSGAKDIRFNSLCMEYRLGIPHWRKSTIRVSWPMDATASHLRKGRSEDAVPVAQPPCREAGRWKYAYNPGADGIRVLLPILASLAVAPKSAAGYP